MTDPDDRVWFVAPNATGKTTAPQRYTRIRFALGAFGLVAVAADDPSRRWRILSLPSPLLLAALAVTP